MTAASLPADGAHIARLAGLGSLALLAGALAFQYLGGVVPCEMCHWQRWAHIAAALLGLVLVSLWQSGRHQLAMVVLALVTVAALIAAYRWNMLPSWQPQVLAAILIVLLGVPLWKKDLRLLTIAVIVLVMISGLIAAYQAGMQMGLLPGPQACTVDHPYVLGSNAPPPVVRCDVVTWSLFGLSLASYNALFSFAIAGIAGFLLLRKRA